jgi:hypothetical protein
LATILEDQGFTKSLIPDCKWPASYRFSLRKGLRNSVVPIDEPAADSKNLPVP